MPEKYFTPREIAEKYNFTTAAVNKWIRQGKLRAVKLGSSWRVPESALEEFIRSNKKET